MNNDHAISFASKELEDLKIDYTVDVVPNTGAAVATVNLPFTANRAGRGPTLRLQYSSSSGNSLYGFGWSLGGVPSISIDTRKQLPRYDNQDRYAFNGTDELVPALQQAGGAWIPQSRDTPRHWIYFYRTRVETDYARFEKWVDKNTGAIHWRSRDRNNILTIYGFDSGGSSRISDPEQPDHVFSWLVEAEYDRHGNAVVYRYESDRRADLDPGPINEHHRVLRSPGFSQRYLKRILYGNSVPLAPEGPVPPENRWLFQVVFDFGDHGDNPLPGPLPDRVWPIRQDPFSTHRPGFEIRTYRLCRRILLFHHFDELDAMGPVLVRVVDLHHHWHPAASTLESITDEGFRRDPNTGQSTRKALPPLKFEYTAPAIGTSFQAVPNETRNYAPQGLGTARYRWMDLFGVGLPAMVTEMDDAWYYNLNLGGGRFGPRQVVTEKPSARLGMYALSDFDGDGNPNIVITQGVQAGFCEYDRDGGFWGAFRPFASSPRLDAADSLQWIDLNGDGQSDLVISKQDHFTWYPARGKQGFGEAVEFAKPRPNGASRIQHIGEDAGLDMFFADMTGDGSLDQVMIRNGSVEYWPQKGYGSFGDGVLMDGAPVFDFDAELDSGRIRLVDIDGNGTADILYIGRGEIRYWLNASGNRLIEGGRLVGLPYIDNLSSVQVLDLLGDGTPCLVWVSAALRDGHHPLQYLPLTGGVKPRLLAKVDNSMGRVVTLAYSSSARHYLRDRIGDAWTTRLPLHVMVVDRKEVIDEIGNSRFVGTFEYHDGSFDSQEKQFNGFGRIDQFDSELFGAGTSATEHVAPACTRTWFHNGASTLGSLRTQQYYRGDVQHEILPASAVDVFLDADGTSFADSFRALNGQMVRQEVFEITPTGAPGDHPYQVVQKTYRVRQLQPATATARACFTFYLSETLSHQYDRQPEDPRVTHRVTLDRDEYGNVTRSCDIGYPRRAAIPSEPDQTRCLIHGYTNSFSNIDGADRHELGVPIESREFEITSLQPATDRIFAFDVLRAAINQALAAPLEFHEAFTRALAAVQARLVRWQQHYYWNDARTLALPFGHVGTLTLLHHRENACFSDGLIGDIFGGFAGQNILQVAARYTLRAGYWWQPENIQHYFPADRFNLLLREERPDSGLTHYLYDAPYYLTLTEIRDALGNRTRAEIDYHNIVPHRITDPNDNISEILHDPLGVMVVLTRYGHVLGDGGAAVALGNEPLAAYREQPQASFDAVTADPARFVQGVSQYRFYELDTWAARRSPPRIVDVLRESFVYDGHGGATRAGQLQTIVRYQDGFGRVLQDKLKVESGMAVRRDVGGAVVLNPQGVDGTYADERWLVSGHTVYNNKQLTVRQYEPFFSTTAEYESDAELQTYGVSTSIHYDAIGREQRVDIPNGTLTRIETFPWETREHDAIDTIEASTYKAFRESLPDTDPQKQALLKAQALAGTPTVLKINPAGHKIVEVQTGTGGAGRIVRTVPDSRGDPIQVIDPRGVTAFVYRRDMVGRVLYQKSVDAGETWSLPDSMDQRVHQWDSRGVHTRTTYDTLGRPTSTFVEGAPGLNQIVERMVYGEDAQAADAQLRNARGRLVVHYDQAGVLTVHQFDLQGNRQRTERRLLTDARNEPDWGDPAAVPLDAAVYETRMDYDAFGRVMHHRSADGTARAYQYLPGGGVSRVNVSTADNVLADAAFLDGAAYNARRQRTFARFGNGVELTYSFDPELFRLSRYSATRVPLSIAGRPQPLLDIEYVYDAMGNVSSCVDHAQEPSSPFHLPQGLTVSSRNDYTYDAFYQLKSATGRVHQALAQHDYRANAPGTLKGTRHLHLNNGQAVERYRREYDYDLSGNILRVRHLGTSLNWTTEIWTSTSSNRSLPARDIAGNPVVNGEARFDGNGNALYLPHLTAINWNHRNTISRAVVIDRSDGGRLDDAEYYVYGGDGQRVRKITDRLVNGGLLTTEKIYLDGCEITRVRLNAHLRLERLTSHVTDASNRIALLHQWTVDELATETDDVAAKISHYQIANHLGSSVIEMDGDGGITDYEEYFPYGGTAYIAGEQVRSIRLKDYRYTAKEQDETTGLYYYGYRYYAPWIGSWLSPDPAGPADSVNLYVFAQNNPIRFIDEAGLQAEEPEEEQKPLYPDFLRLRPQSARPSLETPSLTVNLEQFISTFATIGPESAPPAELEPGQLVRTSDVALTREDAPDLPIDAYSSPWVTLGLGVLAIVGSVIVIASGGSALVLIGAALALSSGIAAVGGSTAIIVSDAFTDVSPEEIGRQTDMLNLAVGYASGIGPLVGGTFALVYAGDEQGFARGVAIGGLVEFGLTASFYGSRALYNTSSYGKAEAALKLPEFQVADDVLLAARADEVRRLERAGFSEAPWEIGTSPLAGVESQLGRSVGAAQEGSLRLPWENLRNRGDLLRVAREVRNRAEFSVRENPGLIRDYFELGPPSIGVDFNLDDVYSVLRAEDLAQQVQTQWATHGIDPGLRPFAAVAISKNGHVVTGISMRGFELELHSQVIDEYNNIVQAMQSPYHLRCGEALCLSKALETLGFDLRGAASAAVQIHAPGHPCYLQWLQPCESCAPVLSAFGVRPAR